MSIANDTTKFILAWCLVIAQIQFALPSKEGPSPSLARQRHDPKAGRSKASTISPDGLCYSNSFSAPHRARVFYRWPTSVGRQRVAGCINDAALSDGAVGDDLLGAVHLQQADRRSIKRMEVRVRVSPPSTGLQRPLTLLLDSSSGQPLSWHLDLSELLYAKRAGEAAPSLRHTVVLTNNKSDIFSEQVHPETFLNVLRRPDLAKPTFYGSRNNRSTDLQVWRRRLEAAGLGRLGFLVAFSSSHGNEDSMDPKVFNAVDVQLPEMRSKPRHDGCKDASPELLSRLVSAMLESVLEAGFSACRSHLWENFQTRETPSRHFLELMEFAVDFTPRRRRSRSAASNDEGLTLRLVAPPQDTPGAASRIVIAIFAWQPFELKLDTRAVRRRIEVVSNLRPRFLQPNHGRHWVNLTQISTQTYGPSANELFLKSLSQRLGGFHRWSLERINFTRPLQINRNTMSGPSLVDLRLHEAPLLLADLEPWVRTACFDTKDLMVGVPSKPFLALKININQVHLGGQAGCSLLENATKWWRRWVFLGGNSGCQTIKQNVGGHSLLLNWLSLNVSNLLPPYRLYFECMYLHSPLGQDLPDENKESNAGVLWSRWNDTTLSYETTKLRSQAMSTKDFSLELFLDREMQEPLSESKPLPKTGQRLFGRVQPAHQSVEEGLMIRDCLLSGKSNRPPNPKRHYILHHGCEMGAYFVWEHADSFRVKRFSFELPRPNFFDEESALHESMFYIHCSIQPCNFFHKRAGLPRCWNQRYICQLPNTPAALDLKAGPYLGSDLLYENGTRPPRITNPLPPAAVVTGVPLWGAGLIALFAFFCGVLLASVLWLVHHLTRHRGRTRLHGADSGLSSANGGATAERENRLLLPNGSAANGFARPPQRHHSRASAGAQPDSAAARVWHALRRRFRRPRRQPLSPRSGHHGGANGVVANGACGQGSSVFGMCTIDTAAQPTPVTQPRA